MSKLVDWLKSGKAAAELASEVAALKAKLTALELKVKGDAHVAATVGAKDADKADAAVDAAAKDVESDTK